MSPEGPVPISAAGKPRELYFGSAEIKPLNGDGAFLVLPH